MALSDTEYLSFGEDLFSNEESFAINNSIYASKEGVSYRGKKYLWDQNLPLLGAPLINGPEKNQLDKLERRYKSTMTIVDFYLESLLGKTEKSK